MNLKNVEALQMQRNDQRSTSIESNNPETSVSESDSVGVEVTLKAPKISSVELWLGLAALFIWLNLFAGGILVDTKLWRGEIFTNAVLADELKSWIGVLCFWTVTNVAILSIIASVVGALGNRMRFTERWSPPGSIRADEEKDQFYIGYYVSAAMRGFGVYALVVSGLLLLATETLAEPSQDQYLRLAGTVSLISFYAGYDPHVIRSILGRISRFLEKT